MTDRQMMFFEGLFVTVMFTIAVACVSTVAYTAHPDPMSIVLSFVAVLTFVIVSYLVGLGMYGKLGITRWFR